MYGLPKADFTHLTPTGLITHGEQIFENFTLLLAGQKPASSCEILSSGTATSTFERASWGQSFKPDCSSNLDEITFNSASDIASSFTISISNGADFYANQLYSQSLSAIIDGDNLVSMYNLIYLDKEHT
tara:strand:+ start:79 stop:465 length:387 start_codon:yes stop_codon:yes gene_type:complete